MTDTVLMSVATSCASDPTDVDRLAASLEAIALTFGHSAGTQTTTCRGEGQGQYVDGVVLAA